MNFKLTLLRCCSNHHLLFCRFKPHKLDDRLPVIDIPKYLTSQKSRKVRRKIALSEEEFKRRKTYRGNRNIPVLTYSKDCRLNHYFGQTYPTHKDIHLASLGWKNNRHYNERIVFEAYDDNPSIFLTGNERKRQLKGKLKQKSKTKEDNETRNPVTTFELLKLNEDVCKAIKQMKIKLPTEVQCRTIPAILEKKNVISCAEAGSGKTLAYLAPIIQLIQEEKLKEKDAVRDELDNKELNSINLETESSQHKMSTNNETHLSNNNSNSSGTTSEDIGESETTEDEFLEKKEFEAEKIMKEWNRRKRPRNQPKCMIVVPGRELAEQIGKVAIHIGNHCRVGVAPIFGGIPKHFTHSGMDVVISTLGLMRLHIRRGEIAFISLF